MVLLHQTALTTQDDGASSMGKTELPSIELLRKALDYDRDTGRFLWATIDEETCPHMTPGGIRYMSTRFLGRPALASKKGRGYLGGMLAGVHIKAHRAAWAYVYGQWPEANIDHINGDTSDNRIDNLRDVSALHNMRNVKRRVDNQSGYTGVHFIEKRQTWVAQIRGDDGVNHVWYFKTLPEAVAARKVAEKILNYHSNHGR